jgi:hypothetical protein
MLNKLKNVDWTRTMFLVPILLVAGISISHVVSWYDMANPYNWAIYLSVAIEIGAMTSLVAATKKIKGGVWFMFGIVTFIQIIGNIFYCYAQIDDDGELFRKWIELTSPVFESMGTDADDIIPHKRWLALLEGGLLPLISLTSLHFYTKYERDDDDTPNSNNPPTPNSNNPAEKLDLEPTVLEQPNNESITPLDDWDEDHAMDMVMNNMLEDFTEEELEEIVSEVTEKVEPEENVTPENVWSAIEEENPEDEIIEVTEEENPKEYKEELVPVKKELPQDIIETQKRLYPNMDDSHREGQKIISGDQKKITFKRDKITQKKING